MGNIDAWFTHLEVTQDQNVEVKGAGAVGNACGSVAAVDFLDAKEVIKEGMRGKFCVEGYNRIEKTRLIGETNGGGAVERGSAQETAQGFEVRSGGGEGSFGRTGGAGQV
jgi:hypothetical protein